MGIHYAIVETKPRSYPGQPGKYQEPLGGSSFDLWAQIG